MHLSHCRSKLDRNRPSLQDRVLPLFAPFKRLQTALSLSITATIQFSATRLLQFNLERLLCISSQFVMNDTFFEEFQQVMTSILGCVQPVRATEARGLPLGHWGWSLEAKKTRRAVHGSKGHFLRDFRRGEGTRKNRSFCAAKKRRALRAARYFFASLTSVAAARTLVTSKALKQGHSASQNRPPFCASMIWEKSLIKLLLRTRAQHK